MYYSKIQEDNVHLKCVLLLAFYKLIYHMTLLLFSGKRHAINNVMTTHFVSLHFRREQVMS